MFKLFVNILAYTGLSLGFSQEILSTRLIELMRLDSLTAHIVIYLGILFWIVKFIWYIYDKFYLERKERLKKLKSK